MAALPYRLGLLMAVSGTALISLEGLLIRLSAADLWAVVWWRGVLLAATMLAAAGLWRGGIGLRPLLRRAPAMAVLAFAAAVGFFVAAVQGTTVANTLVVAGATPFLAALFGWAAAGERVPWPTWAAAAGVCLGLLVIFAGSIEGGHLAGDLCALGYAACTAAYFVALRRTDSQVLLPLVAVGGLLSAAAAWPLADPLAVEARGLVFLAVLGAVVVPAATVLFAFSTRVLSAADVTLQMLLEIALAPLWVWLALGESPAHATFVGGSVVVAVIAAHGWWTARRPAGAAAA